MRHVAFIVCTILLIACNNASEQVIDSVPKVVLKNKIGLNAFSFNRLLRADSIDIFGLLDYSAETGFDGVDITGYYFKDYPKPPSDKYIYSVKKRAYELGLDICGTGVKNDFCNSDPEIRNQTIELTKQWILVAEKLGAPAIRVFQGTDVSKDHSWDEMAVWVADAIRECADFGEQHGIMIEVQNHNSFLKTAEDVNKIMEMIDHKWVGLMLDVGSFQTADPYKDIEETIKYAISWQLKENVFVNGERRSVDLEKIKKIIINSDYKGYLPIETLGEGDPYMKVSRFHSDIIRTFK